MAGGIQETETFATIPPEGTAPVEQQTPPPAEDAIDMDDPDAVELFNAKREAEAEQAGAQGGEGDEPHKAATEKQDAQAPGGTPPAATPEEKTPPIMIPKERLDEVLRRNAELERTSAYIQGQLEATRALRQQPGQDGQQPPQQRQPTPVELLQQVHAEKDALAAKFDDGEITYAQLKAQERDLDNREFTLREQMLMQRLPKPEQPKPQQTQAQGDSLYLQTVTAQLEQQHPWVNTISEERFQDLTALATNELTRQGFRFDGSDQAKYALRQKVAQLSDQYGPIWAAQSGTPAPPPPSGPSAAAAARAAKLQLQGQMPPDLHSQPNQGGTAIPGELSDSDIETMSDEEIIASMPAAARRKMLGITD